MSESISEAWNHLAFIINDQEWIHGEDEHRFDENNMIEMLRKRGVSRADAIAVIQEMVDRKVFLVGDSFCNLRTFVRLDGSEQTTEVRPNRYLSITQQRWRAWTAERSQADTPLTAPPTAGTQQSEGEEPGAQSAKQLLHGWRAIDEALGLSRSYPNMNYDERRRKLAYLNRRFGGPIKAGGKGSQPVVNRSELIAWWNSLEDQVEDQKARIRDKQATLQSRHQYGRTAQVAPDLGGSVRRRKSSRSQT